MHIRPKKPTFIIVVTLTVFAAIYSSISLVNHYNFRTYAFDLGVFNHAVYCFSHFKPAYFTLSLTSSEVHYLADHFSPITILYSPLYYLFGTYTLLIIQIAAILFGALGLYRVARFYLADNSASILAMVHFMSMWGIYSALGFDFHNNVIAAMLVPWFIYFWKQKQQKHVLIVYFLLLLTKENIPLWLCFIILGLIIEERSFSFRKLIRFEIPLLLFASVYFLFVVGVLLPYLIDGHTDSQLGRYRHIGEGVGGILKTIFDNPKYVFSLFFESHQADSQFMGVKSELYFALLFSGGLVLLYKPQYLIMAVPILMQKMLSDTPNIWGVSSQYSVEFVPIVSIALVVFLSRIKKDSFKLRSLYLLAVILAAWVSYSLIQNNKSLWYDNTRWAFFEAHHYKSDLNREEIIHMLNQVPDNKSASVAARLSPYLERREKLYIAPYTRDAEYVLVFPDTRDTYPLDHAHYELYIDTLRNNGLFDVVDENESLILFRKKLNDKDF